MFSFDSQIKNGKLLHYTAAPTKRQLIRIKNNVTSVSFRRNSQIFYFITTEMLILNLEVVKHVWKKY